MRVSHEDLSFINQTLLLAKKGIGRVSPNPLVGAVLVKRGQAIATSFYTYEEKIHAEVKAIAVAQSNARGSTLYINLEPCAHFGRTPPCVDSIIRAGIKRVVASMKDPNPAVAGRGFRKLKAAGIKVDVGILQPEARRLNEAFVKYITRKEPFVLLKAGMSIDGKIATRNGQSKWITSEQSRNYVQKLRWEYDAVLVGVNTILRDDPALTLRIKKPKRRPLTKVILDSRLRTPLRAKVLHSTDHGQVIIYTTKGNAPKRTQALQKAGVSVRVAPSRKNHIDLKFVCRDLAAQEISSLIIEGGSEVNWSALKQRIVDKVLFIAAPKIIGGQASVPVIGGKGVDSLAGCFHLKDVRTFVLDSDLAIEGYVT